MTTNNVILVIVGLCSILFGFINLSVIIWSGKKLKKGFHRIFNTFILSLYFVALFYSYSFISDIIDIKGFIVVMLAFFLLGMLIRMFVEKRKMKD